MEKMNIVKNGKDYMIHDPHLPIEIIHRFSAGVYELTWDAKFVPYIREANELKLPMKLYDIEKGFRRQVLHSFNSKNENIGVLLSGKKGMGKSVNAKLLARECKLPIILLTRPIPNAVDFIGYLNSITQDICVLCDEFEKNFPKNASTREEGEAHYHTQNSFLTFMDGTVGSNYKKLFILTTNDEVNDKLMNRPSRVRYYKKYDYMEKEVYDMIIKDKLVDKCFEEDLREHLTVFDCNVDLLCTIIDEVNTHSNKFSSFKEFFNLKPTIFRYELSRRNKEGRFVFVESFTSRKKYDKDATSINKFYNVFVIDASEEALLFKTNQWVWYNAKLDEISIDEQKGKDWEQVEREMVYRIKEDKLLVTGGYDNWRM